MNTENRYATEEECLSIISREKITNLFQWRAKYKKLSVKYNISLPCPPNEAYGFNDTFGKWVTEHSMVLLNSDEQDKL